jgi:hypothetical protein
MSALDPLVAVDDAVAHVLSAAPRLATVTNVTVISFSFLEGAWEAMINAPNLTEEVREVADEYCLACKHMTVVRVLALLDRDDRAISYQGVHRCLKLSEVVEALVERMCDDPFQSQHIEDDVRHSINQYCRVYATINWELHGRLTHLRNHGIAHLNRKRPRRAITPITHDELRGLVCLVNDLAECLSPFRPKVSPVREDEITDRVDQATMMWQAVFRAL